MGATPQNETSRSRIVSLCSLVNNMCNFQRGVVSPHYHGQCTSTLYQRNSTLYRAAPLVGGRANRPGKMWDT